jgi:predicted Ser/Thr protein kinase
MQDSSVQLIKMLLKDDKRKTLYKNKCILFKKEMFTVMPRALVYSSSRIFKDVLPHCLPQPVISL